MQKETDALAEADRQALHSETEVVLTEVRALREEVSALKDALRESRQ
jgi:voltage-gated sodium channel